MTISNRIRILCGALLVGAMTWVNPVFAQDDADQPGEVMARGPVHEAYANPAEARPAEQPLVDKEPPQPIEEVPPDQKPSGDNVIWIPGYWSWDQEKRDYLWISGFWRTPPPDRQWMPGHWQQVGDQWQWSPGFWAASDQAEVQYLPPPPAPLEVAPSVPAPDAESTYVPGLWVYRQSRYYWRPGFWLGYRPGWVWVPAHYVWTCSGFVFVEGYWDYPLVERGLLFSPIYFPDRVYLRNRFVYRPRFVVNVDFLFGSLFVRSGYGGYWFGDYFGPTYVSAGFTPWLDVRLSGYSYDPLYSYYRLAFARDRAWDRDLRALYRGRLNGDVPLPPRTLVDQTKIVNSTTVNNITNITNIKNVTVLTPLNQVSTVNKDIKLVKVTPQDLAQQQKITKQFRQAAVDRRLTETKLLTEKRAPIKLEDKPVEAKIATPKIGIAATPGATNISPPVKSPPKPPALPNHEDRPIPKDLIKPKTAPAQVLPKETPPVKKEELPLKKDGVTPKKDTPPLKKELPSKPPVEKKETTPPPPPKKDTPPPVKVEPPQPPVKKESPPPPPAKHDTPPPKKEVPPKKDKDKDNPKDKGGLTSTAKGKVTGKV